MDTVPAYIDNGRTIETFLCVSEMLKFDMCRYLTSIARYDYSNFIKDLDQADWLEIIINFCKYTAPTLGRVVQKNINSMDDRDIVSIIKNVENNDAIILKNSVLNDTRHRVDLAASLFRAHGSQGIVDISRNGPFEFLYDTNATKKWTTNVNDVLKNSNIIAKFNPDNRNHDLPFIVKNANGCECCESLCIRYGSIRDCLDSKYNSHNTLNNDRCVELDDYTTTLVSLITTVPRSTLYKHIMNPYTMDDSMANSLTLGSNFLTRLGSSMNYFNSSILKMSQKETERCTGLINSLLIGNDTKHSNRKTPDRNVTKPTDNNNNNNIYDGSNNIDMGFVSW